MTTTPSFPETNLTAKADLKNAITIDVTNTFKENLNKLIEMLGITRKISLTSGSTIKTYKGYNVTLASGDGVVPEGDVIPLSKVTQEVAETKTVSLKKYRKATSGEAIALYGTDNAIANTDEALIRKIQKGIRTSLVAGIKKGTGTQTALGHGFQGALASAWGKLQTLFEDYGVENAVVFANPLDIAKYVANAQVTTQTAFGLTYLVDFTGTVIISTTDVEQGKIWATVPENIVFAYINPSQSDVAKAFGLASDETGYIGMTHFTDEQTLTYQTLVLSGIEIYAERLDGIVKVKLTEPAAAAASVPTV